MPRFFLPLLFLIAAILFSIPAQAKVSTDQFRPLTEEEEKTFYPMVCNGPPSQGECDNLLDNIESASGGGMDGGPGSIKFVSIAYGSYSKAGADEALIIFGCNMGGEVSGGAGAALFERDKGHWKLAGFAVYSMMSSCLLVPGRGRQRMLCFDDPFLCCEANQESLQLITVKIAYEQSLDWNVVQEVLEARDGLRAYEEDSGMAGGYEFCKAGRAGKTILTRINNFERSDKPGVLAEADVEYVVPAEAKRACNKKQPREAKSISGKVQFVLVGHKIKTILPKGVTSLSAY